MSLDPFGRRRPGPDQPALAIENADDERAGTAPDAPDPAALAEAVADALDVIAACETARAEALADVGRIAATRRAAIARVVTAAGGVNAAARALDMSPTVVSRAMKDDDA